jgi:hypothetical protein
MKKVIPTLMIAGTVFAAPAFASLDSDDATVSMNVGLYASVTGLDDFTLTPDALDGAASATYSGSDSYNLESNGQVRVTLSGADLSNGVDSVSTAYALDSAGTTFDTTADVVHNAAHEVSAQATLGEISSQKAGAYSAEITLTVSAL